MQNNQAKSVSVPGDTKVNKFKLITDGFSIKINPEVLHEYAERNGIMQCSYSLVRACFLRDMRAGLIH